MSHGIRKANLSSEFVIIDQKALLHFFFIRRTSAPNYKKNTALKLCVCVTVSRMAVEWGLAEEILSIFFFIILIPGFSVEFFYNIHSSWH